jgi:UDP-3-O-[3-hydroxymyristoyl] glucosamine N-acyltransferase
VDEAGAGDVGFIANPKYVKHLQSTKASAVIVGRSVTASPERPDLTLLRCRDPYFGYRQAIVFLYGFRRHPHSGVHPAAHVDPTAVIGEGTVIYPGVYVGPGTRIGRDCILYPNVVVYDGCVIGDRVIIHACSSIGHDGFGHSTHKDDDGVYRHHKIPQVGNVVVENDVEIGANCSIDRAAMGSTIVGHGSKFSNNIAIGHGTKIGPHALLVAQAGIAGSTTIGKYLIMGGQSGIAGHLKVGNGVTVAAKSTIVNDTPDGMKMMGFPGIPLAQGRRSAIVYAQLPELLERIRRLEKALGERSEAETTGEEDAPAADGG